MKVEPKRMGIHVKSGNMEKSVKFYLNLGFKPVFAYGSPYFLSQFDCPNAPENYNGVTFQVGKDALFEIADGHVAVKSEVFKETVTSSKMSAYFDIESVDEFVKKCEENGIAIIVPPKEYTWGTREVVVKDPDGVVLVFREFLEESQEAQIGK